MTARYPEFEFLATLDKGTVLDGEIVVLRGGKPDFQCATEARALPLPAENRDGLAVDAGDVRRVRPAVRCSRP